MLGKGFLSQTEIKEDGEGKNLSVELDEEYVLVKVDSLKPALPDIKNPSSTMEIMNAMAASQDLVFIPLSSPTQSLQEKLEVAPIQTIMPLSISSPALIEEEKDSCKPLTDCMTSFFNTVVKNLKNCGIQIGHLVEKCRSAKKQI